MNKTALIVIFTLFFLTRLPGLGADIANSDSIRWHKRSNIFLQAVKSKNFKETYQHYQPGVTLMWLNSVVKEINYRINPDKFNSLEDSSWFPIIHGYSKIAVVLTLSVLLLTQIALIKEIFSEKIALLFGFLVSTEVYVIGIDRWFHLTSLEAYSALGAFLALLAWRKTDKTGLLYLTSLLFVFSIYSKLTSLILVPIFLVVFIDLYKKSKDLEPALKFVGLSLLLFLAFFPALWVEPTTVLTNFYNAIVNAVGNDLRSNQLNSFSNSFFYFLILGFKLSPVILIIFLLTLSKARVLIKSKNTKYLLTYFLFYLVFLSLSDKKIDRYSIAFFQPILLLSAIYIANLKEKLKKIILVTIFVVNFGFFTSLSSNYSSYYSPLLGGLEKALNLGVYENSGEYFADAARYLNSKPKALVTVPNNVESFAFYYKGNVQQKFNANSSYIVWSHDIDRQTLPEFGGCEIEKSFGPRGTPVVYVFKCKV